MRVRSGFKQKKSPGHNFRELFRYAWKKMKKLLSRQLFFLKKLSRSSNTPKASARSYLRKDIHKKDFQNPYRKSKRVQTKALVNILSQNRFKLSLSALLVILFIWLIVLFVQPTFYLTRIQVEGTQEIPKEDIITIAKEVLNSRSLTTIRRSHILFIPERKIENAIRDKYGIDSIIFSTHWPSKLLEISVKEKTSVLAYSVGEEYYTIDRQGTIIKQLEDDHLQDKTGIPLIYRYDTTSVPQIGDQVLQELSIQTILELYHAFQKYPQVTIHSFRLLPAEKREVVIPEKKPESLIEETELPNDEEEALERITDAIAQAQTTDEKLERLRELIKEVDIEKIEAGEIERYLDQDKIYSPNDEIQFEELEIYTIQGWSIKLGAEILRDPELTETYLNIFATLANEVDIAGEVKEYVDLRFPGRIYYR